MKIGLALLAVLALAAGVREGFVIDEDLVDELTAKRVHIRLYDEFVERHGRRPDQQEYEGMIEVYQELFRETGVHPRIGDAVPGGAEDEEGVAEEAAYWAFYALLGVAFVFAAAVASYVAVSSRGTTNLYG